MRVSEADTHATRLAMLAAGLALSHQVAAKSLREGLFLATFSVTALPKVMLSAALVAIPMALLVARGMARFGPGRVAPVMFVASALTSLLEWALLPGLPKLVAVLLYLHVSIGGALLVSAFWSIINERFDPHTLKSVVGRIGACSTLGGLLGGLAMERAAKLLSTRSSLLLVAVLALASAFCVRRLGETLTTAKLVPEPASAKASRMSGYLRTLALLVACGAAVSAFGDFALKQAAVAHLTSVAALVRFFAFFYTGTSLASFLIQIFVSRRVLATIGVGATLSVSPIAGVLLAALAFLSPSLLSIGAMRGIDMMLGPSLYRTAFEPLFTPVAASSKRRAKALIDVVFDKGGETLASVMILGVLMGTPALIQRAPLLLVVLFSALSVVLSFRAQRGYVSELEASLRAGASHDAGLDAEEMRRQLLSTTTFGFDRKSLAAQLGRLRKPSVVPARPEEPGALDAELTERLIAEVRTLLGSDVEGIRNVLAQPSLDARLAAFVVPHLARDELVKSAVLALRSMGQDALGVLSEAMHSTALPSVARRRIPHVLRNARGDRVVHSLFGALSAESLEVRYRAALALGEVTRDARDTMPAEPQIFGLVLTELSRGELDRSAIDHLFALLALCLNRASLELARQGLLSDDRKLRGTALEFLESLLPEMLRAPLIGALADATGPREPAPSKQPNAELLEQLRRSFRAELSPPSLAHDPD